MKEENFDRGGGKSYSNISVGTIISVQATAVHRMNQLFDISKLNRRIISQQQKIHMENHLEERKDGISGAKYSAWRKLKMS